MQVSIQQCCSCCNEQEFGKTSLNSFAFQTFEISYKRYSYIIRTKILFVYSGSALLGHCDQLTKIKKLCEKYDIWVHVIGDLLGSLALLPSIKDNVNFNCDSLTIDIMKLFGIQNLPYLTFFLRSTSDIKQIDEKKSLVTSHPLYDFILHSPSISFLSVWSISQRCSHDTVLAHMKQSFDLTNLLIASLEETKTLRILNHDDIQEANAYPLICVGDAPADALPRPVTIFRFSADDFSDVSIFMF